MSDEEEGGAGMLMLMGGLALALIAAVCATVYYLI